jgi:hypothetical protein
MCNVCVPLDRTLPDIRLASSEARRINTALLPRPGLSFSVAQLLAQTLQVQHYSPARAVVTALL